MSKSNAISKFFSEATRLDKTEFSISTGLISAIFVVTPIILVVATDHIQFLFTGLGALWLSNTEVQRSPLPRWILLAACFSESAAFGLGTLASSTNFLLPLLLGVGVFLVLIFRGRPGWAQVATFTAVTFAVGVGLPGASIQESILRSALSLLGGLWALIGVEINHFLASRKHVRPEKASSQLASNPRSETLENALVIAVASALGFTIGLVFGLPRDFWIVVTIITTVRPTFGLTVTFTSKRILGTIAGALIGAALTIEIDNFYLLSALLIVFFVLMFSTRGVNDLLVQLFLTPYLIILLNLVYPSQWEFALVRIFDVALGGAISIATVYLLDSINNSRLAHIRDSYSHRN